MPLTPLPPRPIPGSETFEADAGALLDALPVFGDELNALQEDVSAKQEFVAADRMQTGQDRTQTGLDRTQTGQDRTQTGLDRIAAATSQNDAMISKNAAAASAELSSNNAAEVLSIYGTTAAMQAKLDEAKVQSSAAQTAAASASSVLQQDLSAVSAALHRSPNAIVAQFIYDTSLDSDGGAWVERMQHTNWYSEPLNGAWRGQCASEAACRAIAGAATGDYFQLISDGKCYKLNAGAGTTEVFRGNKAKPSRLPLAVAESSSVSVYDATEPNRPMWCRWAFAAGTFGTITSMVGMQGKLLIGTTLGLITLDFARDEGRFQQAASDRTFRLIDRASGAQTLVPRAAQALLIDSSVSAVAITVLPDAPYDVSAGLQLPTIAVGTAGGVSVIKQDGAVVNVTQTAGGATYNGCDYVGFTKDNRLRYGLDTVSGSADRFLRVDAIPPANVVHSSYSVKSLSDEFYATQTANAPTADMRAIPSTGIKIRVAGEAHASGGAEVFMLKRNRSAPAKGLMAAITSNYATGHMVGDIRRCYLSSVTTESVGPSAELFTNGTFADLTGWSMTTNYAATAAVVAGEMQVTSTVAAGGYLTAISTVIGKTYRVTAAARRVSGVGNVYISLMSVAGVDVSASNLVNATAATPVVLQFTATATTSYICARCVTAGDVGGFDNFSAKEVIADRSYKAAGATIYGTLVKTAVAAAAQLVAYSGFSAANYCQETYSAHLDFGTSEWSLSAWLNYSVAAVATIAERSAATGPSIKFGTDATGRLVASAYDGTTTRSATTASAYNSGVWTKVRVSYVSGKLSISVNGVEVASSNGAPLLTLSNAAAVLTIGNSFALDAPFPGLIALLKLGATVPTAEQALWMFEQEKQMFRDGAQVTLPAATAVLDLAYDESQDKWAAMQAGNESSFTGLVRTANITPSAGSFSKVNARSGIKLQARTTTNPGVDVTIPTYGLREEIVRRAEAAAKASKPLTPFDFDAVAAQTDFVLPVGWTAAEVISVGANQREGATKNFTRVFDGFRETIRFAVAPGASAWVQINAKKE